MDTDMYTTRHDAMARVAATRPAGTGDEEETRRRRLFYSTGSTSAGIAGIASSCRAQLLHTRDYHLCMYSTVLAEGGKDGERMTRRAASIEQAVGVRWEWEWE